MNAQTHLRVLIADDHVLFRRGLRQLLNDCLSIGNVVEAVGLDEALEEISRDPSFDLALFDLSMAGMKGPESLKAIKTTYPTMKVAIISGSLDQNNLLATFLLGLNGYIPKGLSEAEIADALRQIVAGRVFIPRPGALPGGSIEQPTRATSKMKQEQSREVDLEDLTLRQREVLHSVMKGLSNKQTAAALGIAESTVKIHLGILFLKFGASNREELASMARHVSSQ